MLTDTSSQPPTDNRPPVHSRSARESPSLQEWAGSVLPREQPADRSQQGAANRRPLAQDRSRPLLGGSSAIRAMRFGVARGVNRRTGDRPERGDCKQYGSFFHLRILP